MNSYPCKFAIKLSIISLLAYVSLANADEHRATDKAATTTTLEDLVIIGSRTSGRSSVDSPVPVDIVSGEELFSYGGGDLSEQLSRLIPSYNLNEQPISDAATFIRPFNLRGLPPDSTLIMINGKRRHRAAVISLLGGGVSNGSQSVDVSTIPAIALKRVEVLRDGASAQYGSDAIAGVVNFELKDVAEGGSVNLRWGEFYQGDGESLTVAANIGLPLTDAGFVNLSSEFKQADATDRSVQRDNALELIERGVTGVRNPAQIWGSPAIDDDYKLFVNSGFEINQHIELYAFGNYAERKIKNGFFFRSPGCEVVGDANKLECGAREGVFALTSDAAAKDRLPAINDFRFGDRFPNGFTPQFSGQLTDESLAGGIRGTFSDDWSYDISVVYGDNQVDFFLENTINAQLVTQGQDIQTSYELGSHIETEYTYNLDLSRAVELPVFASPLYVSVGAEYRHEAFEIKAGETNSWYVDEREIYNAEGETLTETEADPDPDSVFSLSELGYSAGANGFNGFRPDTAGKNDRESWAAYLDLEADVIDTVFLNLAGRYENYEDFGNTVNGKISAIWQATAPLSFRASIGTGFRVPTVGQINLRSVTTELSDGKLRDSLLTSTNDPLAIANGAKPLKAEQSINFSVGTVLNIANVAVTADYFRIKVEDRISLIPSRRVMVDPTVSQIRYFANAFDTTTQGVDIVATSPREWLGGETLFSLIGNWTDTKVDRHDADIITPQRVKQLEGSLPKFRVSFEAKHTLGNWQFLARERFYDDFYEYHIESFEIYPDARWLTDIEVAYKPNSHNEQLTLAVGARNVFDVYPSKNPYAGATGSEYPESVPYSFNGGFYYASVNYTF